MGTTVMGTTVMGTTVTGMTVMLRWEPCETYDANHECELGTCVHCGWPGDDHDALIYAHAA